MLDFLLLYDINDLFFPRFFITSLIYDETSSFMTLMLKLPQLFYSDFQDFISTLLHYSPDLIFVLYDLLIAQ